MPQAASKGEVVIVWSILVVLLLLRIRYLWAAPFDTDEAQHLHVVWGWTTGKLPYRDFFDNHVPLFHVLCTPIIRLFGERANILLIARAAMIPLWLCSLSCIAALSARIYTARAALWTVALAAASARFFFKMGEFRTDVLWTLLWFAVLVCFSHPNPRFFKWGGLLLGAAFAVSLKTSMMLIALVYAGVAVALFAWRLRRRGLLAEIGRCLLPTLVAFVLIPALVIAYFAWHGALADMKRCVITHNELPGVDQFARAREYILPILAVVAASLGGAYLCIKNSLWSTGTARAFILLATAGYYILVRFCWPIVTAQDYAPLDPLFFAWVTPLLLIVGEWLATKIPEERATPFLRSAPVVLVLLFNLWGIYRMENPLRNLTQPEITMVGDVLALTSPSEYVMDNKGETIFRNRAYYYVLETLTLERMKRGLLEDDMVERMIATHTAVVHGPLHMPEPDVNWERANYVSVGAVDVLGMKFPKGDAEVFPFKIVIPDRFAIVTDHGNVAGTLDGEPITGPRDLAAGPHEFRPVGRSGQRYAAVWARAVEKGYSPFSKQASQ
jgi:hypothetical protein